MRNRSFLVLGVCALALAAPASSQILTAGIDVWTTPNDGSAYVDFTQNPIPAGFFCTGSQAFAQKIAVKGSPIATTPSGVLGSTDTIVERASDVNLSSGVGSTAIRVRAISFVNSAAISVSGCSNTFSAKVGLNGAAPNGNLTIRGSVSAGGTFDADFTVPGKVTFTNNSTGQPLSDSVAETVRLQTTGAPWSTSVGTGGIAYANQVTIDSDGNGVPDYTTRGTTPGFAPGWWNGVPVKVDHHGPHPTWPLPPPPPPPPCPRSVFSAVSSFEADQAGTLSTSTTTADEVTVLSSTEYAGQRLTLVDHATELTSPCLAVTKTGTYLVVDRQ
jgi:hypothetical protein